MEQKQAQSIFDREASVALKGIAIVMMVLHHCFRVAKLYEGYEVSFFPFGEQQIVNVAFACKICVSVFAFISGYGLESVSKSINPSESKRNMQIWRKTKRETGSRRRI